MEEIITTRQAADQWYNDWFAFNGYYSQWAKQNGLNFTLLFCLYAIGTSVGQPTPGQLAEQLYLSKQTVNSALDILENKGYITRSVAPNNRRSRLISMTEAGRELTEQMLNKMNAFEEKVFGQLSIRDRKTLQRIMSRLVSGLEKAVQE